MKSGVYQIRNLVNGKCYIGSALVITRRWRDHRRDLRANRHHSTALQRAWNKYGADVFVFEILEECLPEQCVQREQCHIDTCRPLYNICKIAGSRLGVRHTNETKQKIAKSKKGQPSYWRGKKLPQSIRSKMSQNHANVQGSNHPNAKLTESDVVIIKQRLQNGEKGAVIARDFKVSRQLVTEIKSGRAWRHI